MNRRMGEGGEGDAGIKRNILRPEIRGNTKRNVNCIRKEEELNKEHYIYNNKICKR